jgi:hypothetical protein
MTRAEIHERFLRVVARAIARADREHAAELRALKPEPWKARPGLKFGRRRGPEDDDAETP